MELRYPIFHKIPKWLFPTLLISIIFLSDSNLIAGGGPNVSGAKLYIQQNELDKALNVLLKEVNEVNAKNEDAWYLLGYVYARQKEYDKMVDAFNKALELKPKFKDKGIKISKDSGQQIHSQFGTELILKVVWGNAFNAGVKAFNDAINASDEPSINFSEIENGMTSTDVEQKLGKPIEINVTKIDDVEQEQWVYGPSNYVYLKDGIVDAVQYTKETSNNREQFYERAVLAFRDAAMIMPDSTLAYRNMAAGLLNLGKHDESLEPLQEALKHNPDDSEVKIMLAQVYMQTEKDSLAIPVLEDLWGSGNHTAEIADYLSRAYIKTGKSDQAKTIYKEAIESNPGNFHFRYNYGTILLEANEYDQAIEQLTKAYAIDSATADINYNLGAAYLNRAVGKREALPENSEDKAYMEDFEFALPYLERSVKMNPDDEGIWFSLGRIAGQLNKMALAGYAFSKGEPTKSVLNDSVRVGMPTSSLKSILGEPDEIKPIESEQLLGIEEWIYNEGAHGPGKIAITDPVNIYVTNGRVDALFVNK